MTKPTGRPRGRPKTKDYATLMARIPQELVDWVHTYRSLHQTSVSEVIREGLEALRNAPDILSYRYSNMSDTNEDVSPLALGNVPDVSPGYGFADDVAALPVAVEPREPPAPVAGAMKQCRKKHPPYPASKPECPVCVAARQARVRQRAKQWSAR